MEDNYWFDEYVRIGLVFLAGLASYLFFDQWLWGLLIGLLCYSVWMLCKLHQLQKWIADGEHEDELPDSNGVWEQVSHLILKAKLARAKNKKKQRHLLKNFNTLVSTLPDAILMVDNNGVILWGNEATKVILNIHSKKDVGLRIDNLIRNPEFKEIIDNPNVKKEVTIRLRHNEALQIGIRVVPLKSHQRIVVARDVSEEFRLRQSRKAFIANASHELRTPLTVIKGYLEILEDAEGIPSELQNAIQSASFQSARMESLIKDMLSLSNLENTRVSKTQSVYVADIIDVVCNDAQQTLAANTHNISKDCQSDLTVSGSQKEIESVVHNLIYNAINHTKNGSSIHVRWYEEDDSAVFSVTDDGDGIPEQDIAHLTERFYRADSSKAVDKEGTGLGLSIVKHIMQRHNGDMYIESEVGEGSTFKVMFPRAR